MGNSQRKTSGLRQEDREKNQEVEQNVNEHEPKDLMSAAEGGNLELVRRFVEHGNVDVRVSDNSRTTVLIKAAGKGHFEIVRYLAELTNVDVNARDMSGFTALTKAAENGHTEIVRYLCEQHNSTRKDDALAKAAGNGHLEVVRYLCERPQTRNGLGLNDVILNSPDKRRHVEVGRYFVECGVNINTKTTTGNPIVMEAAGKGHFDVVEYLVECGANINAKNFNGDTVMMKAAERGNAKLVQYYAEEAKADVNARNHSGKTALLLAASYGHINVVQYLIEFGADLTLTDKDGCNALMRAASNDNLDVVRFLIDECPVDVNALDNYGYTALIWAARGGHVDTVQHLAQHNASLNTTDRSGDTALIWAAGGDHIKVIRYLAGQIENIDATDEKGDTALMWAAEKGHVEAIRLLAEFGANLNIIDTGNHTALMKATMNKHVNAAQFLVESGAEVNITDDFGYTALLMAAKIGCFEIVQYLVEHGGTDLNMKDKKGETALMKAAGNNHIDIVRYLVERKVDVNAANDRGFTALILAAKWGNLELVRCIAEHPDAMVNIPNRYGSTALIKAAINGRIKIVRYLAGQCEADVNITDGSGDTALILAAERGHTKVVQYLAEDCGANVNTMNNEGITALMWASERGYLSIVECFILQHGVETNIADNEGRTALMKAVVNHHLDIVRFLIYQGKVDVNAKNSRGETAFRLAYNRGYQDIKRLLTPFLSSIPHHTTIDVATGDVNVPSEPSELICCSIPPSEVTLVGSYQHGNIGGEYRAKWLDADTVVKLYIPEASNSTFDEEGFLWQNLRHPNIIKIYGACYVNPHLQFFVCEYANNGSLVELVKMLADVNANATSATWKYLHEAALGLAYLHERGIVHGDLRCCNILVGKDRLAKVSNFRLSSSMDKSKEIPSGIVGSMRWQPPEVVTGEQPSFASDVYSLGMCILEAATMKDPWYGEDRDWVLKYKTRWDPKKNPAEFGPKCPPGDVQDLVWRMCSRDPNGRANLLSIVYELEQLSMDDHCFKSDFDNSISSENSISVEEYEDGKLSDMWVNVKTCIATCDIDNEQHRMFKNLTKVHNILESSTKPKLLDKFYSLLTEFYMAITMAPGPAQLVQLSSTRTNTTKFYALNWRIDSLLKVLQGSIDITNQINTEGQQQLNDRVKRFVTGVSDTDLLLKELKSMEERSAFLKVLKTEMHNYQRMYTSDQIKTMKTTYETMASTIVVNDLTNLTPEWFIPWYELIIDECSELGKGGSGTVCRGKWLDSDVVVKYLRAGSKGSSNHSMSASLDRSSTQLNESERAAILTMFRREVDIWFGLNHPHIIRLFGASHVNLFFVCEYATNGTMVKYLQKYPDQLWVKLYEAALGVQYLHTLGIIHGDLKGNNIVIGSDHKAKVTDFGLSLIAKKDDANPQISAAFHWVAPECLPESTDKARNHLHSERTFASDIYSLGMCIVEALRVVENHDSKDLQFCLPWRNLENNVVRYHVRNRELPSQPTNCTSEQWELVKQMCAFDPLTRIKISTVVDELAKLVEINQDVDTSATAITLSLNLESVPNVIDKAQVLLDRLVNDVDGCILDYSLYFSLWNHLNHVHAKIDDNHSAKCKEVYCSLVGDAHEATVDLQNASTTLTFLTESTMRCYALERRLKKFCEAYSFVYEWNDPS